MSSHKPHITPISVYLAVGTTLLFLTIVTVWVAGYHLGPFNLIVAMAIATSKGALVCMFFMHLLYDNKFYLMIFLSSLLFLAIFISLTMLDTMRRGDIEMQQAKPIKQQAAMYDQMPAADSTSVAE